MIRIEIAEDPNTVRVEETTGLVHTATWNDEEELHEVVGNAGILRAALLAWNGQDGVWEVTPRELEATSQGHWVFR